MSTDNLLNLIKLNIEMKLNLIKIITTMMEKLVAEQKKEKETQTKRYFTFAKFGIYMVSMTVIVNAIVCTEPISFPVSYFDPKSIDSMITREINVSKDLTSMTTKFLEMSAMVC